MPLASGSQLCLHHCIDRELLHYCYQEGGVLQHQTGPLHSTVTCGDGSHRRRLERLPLLPHHLQDSPTDQPPKAHWVLMTPFHLLMGNVALPTLLNVPPGHPPPDMNLPYQSLTLLPTWHLGPHPDPNDSTPPTAMLYPHLDQKPPPEWPLRSHPTQSKGMRCPFTKF